MPEIVCPECLGKLTRTSPLLICSDCGIEWKITPDGIPDFGREEFWWNQISYEDTLNILDIAAMKGWQAALREGLLPLVGNYTYRYASLESRADWHFLLDLNTGANVLDIGCGWGPVTIHLARHYAKVHSIDSNMLTLKFVRMRADQEGLGNIVLARTSPLEWGRLPYDEGDFDLVVLNGVLEWIGAARYEESPDFYQKKALLEIHRVLKPGGLLYVGIENRFAYTSFLGAKSHSGVPFADILPRSLANLLCRLSGQRNGFRTYTYSLAGYRKLFANCGFAPRQAFVEYPTYREADSIIPLPNSKLLVYWAKTHLPRKYSHIVQALAWLRIAPLLAHSYGIVVERH